MATLIINYQLWFSAREFIARALLGVRTIQEALNVLKNPGYGIADGFNVNVHFGKDDSSKVIYSIEGEIN